MIGYISSNGTVNKVCPAVAMTLDVFEATLDDVVDTGLPIAIALCFLVIY